jgi:hypothetical protein
MEVLEMKNSINPVNKVESIANRLNHTEGRLSGLEDKVKEILHSDSKKEK